MKVTERTRSLVVALDKEYREDDVQVIINAIKMIKGVIDVNMNIFDGKDHMNSWASQLDFRTKIIKSLLAELDRTHPINGF
jgi:hypothetical protein